MFIQSYWLEACVLDTLTCWLSRQSKCVKSYPSNNVPLGKGTSTQWPKPIPINLKANQFAKNEALDSGVGHYPQTSSYGWIDFTGSQQ